MEQQMKLKKIDLYSAATAVCLMLGYLVWSNYVKEEKPAEEWFVVKNIAVPNFIEGDDPLMIYDREVKLPFDATWNVIISRVGVPTLDPVCSGSGHHNYEPRTKMPEAGVTMSFFVGDDAWRNCSNKMKEGQYSLRVSYEMRPEGYPVKHLSYSSNLFRVLPRGAQLYIEPDQLQALEKLTP
jgi:hypothetical protein